VIRFSGFARAAAAAVGILSIIAAVYRASNPAVILILAVTALLSSGLRIVYYKREYETVHTMFIFLSYWYGGVASGLLMVPVLASGSVLGAGGRVKTGIFHLITAVQAMLVLPFAMLFPPGQHAYPSSWYLLLVPLMYLTRRVSARASSPENWEGVAFLGFLINVPAVLLVIHATDRFGPQATAMLCLLCILYLALLRRETLEMARRSERLDRLIEHNKTTRQLLSSGTLTGFVETLENSLGAGLALTEKNPDGWTVWTSRGFEKVAEPPAPRENHVQFLSAGKPGLIITASDGAAESLSALHDHQRRDFIEQLFRTWQVVSARIHQEDALFSVALLLARISDLKDRYTKLHSLRVAALSTAIGKLLSLPDIELVMLRTGALLHDIGKVTLPAEILGKKGILTSMERGIIKDHPREGATLVSGLSRFDKVAETVLHHHERLDGSGYPSGLRGSCIPLHSRIVAVADTFDAITADRPYHPEGPMESALKEVQAGRGTLYDARVVDALTELVESGKW